jgi:mannose-6-phosphate isomerase-like protein (cupin superfamily)
VTPDTLAIMPIRSGDRLDLSPIGAIFQVLRTAEDTNGESLEMEWELAPHASGTPVHIHPTATESYEVIEGKLETLVDGKWRTLSAGESASVPPGVPHTFRNPIAAVSRVRNVHAPAMRFGEYFGTIHHIVKSGSVAHDRMTPKAMLYLSVVMLRFKPEIISVRPPHFVVALSARLARLLGYEKRIRQLAGD